MKNRFVLIFLLTAMIAGFVSIQSKSNVFAAPEDATYQSLPFSQNWTNTGLITANDDWSGVAGIVGFRGDSLTTTDGVDPQTVLVDNSPGVVDINANQTNPNTFTTGGVTEFDIADDVVALTGSGTADAPYVQLYLNTTGWQNLQISYQLRDIDGSTDNAVQPVALQYRIGASGNFTNVPAGFVADATTGPSLANLVTTINVILPAAVNNQSQVQIRIMTTNASGNDEWVGIDDILITGEVFTYRTITLDGNVSEWSSISEKLGSASSSDFYITWDDDYWYFGVKGGFSNTNFFLIGIDADPTNETTNTGGTSERCGAIFPSENKPDYILANRQNSYLRESWGWNGSVWDQAAWNPAETSEYDFSGGGGDYEVKLKKSSVFASNEDTSPVAFYLWLSDGSCQTFNAWPPENPNAWTGSTQFLFAHTRFQTTTSGLQPVKEGQRVAWASAALTANSTAYNYFGGDDITANNPWLRLTTTATGAGGASCTVRAKMVGTDSFTQTSFTGVNRYVDFTLTNCTNLEVDVQVRYEELELNGTTEAATEFYHCVAMPCSTSWMVVVPNGGTYIRDATNNNVLLTNVPQTQFSFWTISDTDAPTALTLTHFTTHTLVTPWLLALLTLALLGLTGLMWARKRLHG